MKLSLSRKKHTTAASSATDRGIPIATQLQSRAKPPGIVNVANNCYASSVFHCMLNHQEFRQQLRVALNQHAGQNKGEGSCVADGLRLLDAEYKYSRGDSLISHSKEIMDSLKSLSEGMVIGEQQDAHEFYITLLDRIFEICPRSQKQIKESCCFLENQAVSCTQCGSSNSNVTTASPVLEVYATGAESNIQELVTDAFPSRKTQLGIWCTRCQGKVRQEITSTITSFPRLLCIHLTSGFTSTGVEVEDTVLRLRGKSLAKYKLTGIVVHSQLADGIGHYTAFIRSQDNHLHWFKANDSKVTSVSCATVAKQKPFMLFYEQLPEDAVVSHLSVGRLDRLKDKSWLNDEIIRTHLELVGARASESGKKVFIMNSQFFSKLLKDGYSGVNRWYQKVNLLEQDTWICFINLNGTHWTVLIVDVNKKEAHYYDSYKTTYPQSWRAIRNFITSRCEERGDEIPDWTQWKYFNEVNQPAQQNAFDCGVFVAQTAYCHVMESSWDFNQSLMGVVRKLMLEELLNGCLADKTTREKILTSQFPHNFNYNPTMLLEENHVFGTPLRQSSPAAIHSTSQHKTLGPLDSTSNRQPSMKPTGTVKSTLKAQSVPPNAIATSQKAPGLRKKQQPDTKSMKPIGKPQTIPHTSTITSKNVQASTIENSKAAIKRKANTQVGKVQQSPAKRVRLTGDELKCDHCHKTYKHKSSLSKHMKNDHKKVTTGSMRCHEDKCVFRCIAIKELIHHLTEEHGLKIDLINKNFPSFDSFTLWKNSEEGCTETQYTQKCAPQVMGNSQIWYYYCNRAGSYVPRGNDIRQLKTQGSSKIGHQCTAHMRAAQDLTTGQVSVSYCTYHHSHSQELCHLKISENLKLTLVHKLKQGVTMDRILDDIRSDTSNGLGREHLVKKQQLRNLKAQYNIESNIRHKNDHTSVASWVLDLSSHEQNPVLVFKQQSAEQSEDLDNLASQDFLLGIQTTFQREMLLEFPDTICLDATHGTNAYDFHLITIVVIDEYGEGIPVGWMISNRQDTVAVTEFLKAVRSRTGVIQAKWVMTDDAPQFFNAWVGTFGKHNTKKLLCAWHVDRAWRGALREHIPNVKQQVQVYHQLQALLHEIEEGKFRALMQRFLTSIQHSNPKFHKYFMTNYCNRIEQWASYTRVEANVNTNMFMEAFHRVLKVVYFNHKQNRRIDTLLATLLKIARDKLFDQFVKAEVGKPTHRVCEINKHHKKAQEMIAKQTKITTQLDENKWSIQSQSTASKYYIVTVNNESCECKLRCPKCNICVHNISCTCPVSVLQSTICKHSHFICMKFLCCESSPNIHHQPGKETREYFNALLDPPSTLGNLDSAKKKCQDQVQQLLLQLQACTNVEAITNATTSIKAVISTIRATELVTSKKPFELKHYYPPNYNHTTQYFSTKKKRNPTTSSLSKPTSDELQASQRKLNTEVPDVCAICFKEDDIDLSYSQVEVFWLQCSSCQAWVHRSCVKKDTELLAEDIDETYICYFCEHDQSL